MMKIAVPAGLLLLGMVAGLSTSAKAASLTLVYDQIATEITNADNQQGQLWITTADLTRATRFELKPQGVCRDELCFPLPKSKKKEFVRESSGHTWFNLTAFAQLTRQPVARDEALAVWYFGQRSDQRQRLATLVAPDFALPDVSGKLHSLSDFRGKKVLLITWASW